MKYIFHNSGKKPRNIIYINVYNIENSNRIQFIDYAISIKKLIA